MLGRDRPGSEGNLASDLENQDQAQQDNRALTPAGNGDGEAPKPEASKAEPPKAEAPKNDVVKADPPPKRTRAAAAEKHHAEPKPAAEPKAPVAEPVAAVEVK